MTTGDAVKHSDGRIGTVRACGIIEDGQYEGEEYAVIAWQDGRATRVLSTRLTVVRDEAFTVAPLDLSSDRTMTVAKRMVTRYGLAEAERRAYISAGSDAYRFALIASVRRIATTEAR